MFCHGDQAPAVPLQLRLLQAEWSRRSLTSLSPRRSCAGLKLQGDCSLYSYLTNFMQSELLTGDNKWACESCTAAQPQPGDGKAVLSNASKQLFIFSLPAILSLHLKRFQQTLSGCKKMDKHVYFPLTLNLSSFCSSASRSLRSVRASQENIIYSLYGVVQHSGFLHGAAFVKVRPQSKIQPVKCFSPSMCKPRDVPWLFEQMDKNVEKSPNEAEAPANDSNNNVDLQPEGSSRRLFHVSDTSVTGSS